MSCEDENYTPSFTHASLIALEKAMAGGVKRVKYSDKEIEYRSLTEMVALYRLIFRAVNGSSKKGCGMFGGKKKVARHSKGLEGSGLRECFNGYGDNGDN